MHTDLLQQASAWLEHNRRLLPLNSICWEPLFIPPAGVTARQPQRLGQYEAIIQQPDYFYKPVSKIYQHP